MPDHPEPTASQREAAYVIMQMSKEKADYDFRSGAMIAMARTSGRQPGLGWAMMTEAHVNLMTYWENRLEVALAVIEAEAVIGVQHAP